jgi:hypothetical protein
MLYTRRTFSCPASNNASQRQWDLAFLSDEDYKKKYGETKEQAISAAEQK